MRAPPVERRRKVRIAMTEAMAISRYREMKGGSSMGGLNEWDGGKGRVRYAYCARYRSSRQSDGRIAASRVMVPCESYEVSLEVER